MACIAWTCMVLASPLAAEQPEIAHIHPDFIGAHTEMPLFRTDAIRHTPQIITGENFVGDDLDIRIWAPPGEPEDIEAGLQRLIRGETEVLPSAPPAEARRVNPIDVEEQVLVASLSHSREPHAVVWVGNVEGFSRPYLFNVAKPLWMNDSALPPGGLLRIFGQGLRVQYMPHRVVLVQSGGDAIDLSLHSNPFHIRTDNRLIEATLPVDLPVGDYEVYLHNGYGGAFGWSKAGDLNVHEAQNGEERVFNVREFGAAGDGLADDIGALTDALQAAAEAGGGVVFLPPGTYRVGESLQIPATVTLKGSHRDNTIIKGFGFTPSTGGRFMWNSGQSSPASVVLMESNSTMESLTITGSVARGSGGHSLVQTIVPVAATTFPDGGLVERVKLKEVHLDGPTYHPDSGTDGAPFYSAGFSTGPTFAAAHSRQIRIHDSIVRGNIVFGHTDRSDIIGNTIHQGAVQAAGMFDCFVDANIMRDSPYRLYSYRPVRNTYFRANEMYNFGGRRVSGASESFMLHGGSQKIGGPATGGDHDTLADAHQSWTPGQFKHGRQTVLITAGRGFGQYRHVVDNTEDTLILDRPWRVQPDETSEYAMGHYFVDSVFYDNYNDGLGRVALYWECINITVERHRDNHAGGIEIYGVDRSTPEDPGRYHPSWYNMLVSNHMEGSFIYQHETTNDDNVWSGPVVFGNYIVNNNLLRPVHRNVMVQSWPGAAIEVATPDTRQFNRDEATGEPLLERSLGRVAYTMVLNNTIADADVGIRIPNGVRKTFVMRNTFLDVNKPVVEMGGSGTTIDSSNRERTIDGETGLTSDMPLETLQTDDFLAGKQRSLRAPAEDGDANESVAVFPEADGLRKFLPSLSYRAEDVRSEAIQEQCETNLQQLFDIIRRYDREQGYLPSAAFYPSKPLSDEDSLQVILGDEAAEFLRCPAAGEDFDRLGWLNYIWNSNLNGLRLADITNPSETWVLMDFTAPHAWLVQAGHAGHRDGIHVLYADGSVRWMPANDAKEQFDFVR